MSRNRNFWLVCRDVPRTDGEKETCGKMNALITALYETLNWRDFNILHILDIRRLESVESWTPLRGEKTVMRRKSQFSAASSSLDEKLSGKKRKCYLRKK